MRSHQKYFRDYDPATGKYVQSDPIGLGGHSFSTYAYALNDPVMLTDPTGEDVKVCYYPSAVGHVGVGVAGNQTVGRYPKQDSLPVAFCSTVPGVIQRDDPAHDWLTNSRKQCLTIRSTPAQDAALQRFIDIAQSQPQQHYNLCNNQCTSFVRSALQAAGIPLPAGADDAIRPSTLFNALQSAYSPGKTGAW